MRRIGSDTGGTFTDLVSPTGEIVKVLSTPDDPGRAVAEGVGMLLESERGDESKSDGGDGSESLRLQELAHGTTVATNALLERKGARVALICNEGFADIIEIARQDRPSLYDPFADRPEPLVKREDRLEVEGQLGSQGEEIVALQADSLPALPDGIEAVSVCLLHSDLNPSHEISVRDELLRRAADGISLAQATSAGETDVSESHDAPDNKQTPGANPDARASVLDITCSHEIAPEFREYERASTTVINSYLRPRCRSYLRGLRSIADEVFVMTSAGGLLPASEAAETPAKLLLSGPAGGVRAGAHYAAANGCPDAVTFDMGGTSTDVCLVLGGQPAPAAEREIDGYPVRVMSLDVLTIGAGGGSMARLDSGGALVVGPESAGAKPGPACYGLGGTAPTVTDANLLCGRIPEGATMGNLGALDAASAGQAFEQAGFDPQGVLAVVNANMEQALRAVTTRRGIDPRNLALVAFGGAGPLHACELAELLGMTTVIVPPRAGALSAVGILGAPRQVDIVRSWGDLLDHEGAIVEGQKLRDEVSAQLPEATDVNVAFDCRYEGQSHELPVSAPENFHAEHERQNGYRREDAPVEITAIRCVARAMRNVVLPDLEREQAVGPAVVSEPDTTIWIPEGWESKMGAEGSLVIRRRDRYET